MKYIDEFRDQKKIQKVINKIIIEHAKETKNMSEKQIRAHYKAKERKIQTETIT